MANFTLTTGSDTVTGTDTDDTVYGTTGTLNPSDSLTGGPGTDTLALSGFGDFRVDQLATFTGFENITLLNDFPGNSAHLYLGSQSIAVTGSGAANVVVHLGGGAVTFQGGGGDGNRVVVSDSVNSWNAGNVIDDAIISFGGGSYDLTTNTLTHIEVLFASNAPSDTTVKINSAVAAGVAHFSGNNDQLVTSDAALDLSHSQVTGFTVTSTNAAGTNFKVRDLVTALQIAGGVGLDTITAQGFAFTSDQRHAIFATSVERVVDARGTYGGAGADTFVFDLAALTPAQPGSGVVDRILDYNQGNSGTFNLAEGDTLDFSALLAAGSGQQVGNLVRVLENPSGTAAILQIDQDGAANGAHWTTIAQLDGVHTGDGIKVIFDASQPAATLIAPALVPTHNFNGDGKSDILWQNDSGMPVIWTMDGTNITGAAALPNPGPTWHVAEAADFNGDGKSDILWQNDNGMPAIWTMDGTTITGGRPCPILGPPGMSLKRPISTATASPIFFGRTTTACRRSGPWTAPPSPVERPCPILGPPGMSLKRPISTATASPIFFGSTTAACRRSGPWTAPTSPVERPCPILGPPGMSLKRPISTATASPIFFGSTTTALPAIWTMDGTNITGAAALPNPGPTWHVAEAADFNGDGKSDILWQNDSGIAGDLDHGRHHHHRCSGPA